jgi:hypothetical protein
MPALVALSARIVRRGAVLPAALLVALACPARAHAVPVVDLGWQGCTSPINRNAGVGPIQSVFVSETGLANPILAAQVILRFRSLGSGLGDAWRFDVNGCEATHWNTVLASTSSSCPALPFLAPQTISDFSYFTTGPYGSGKLLFAIASQTPATPASGRNMIVEFDFDQTSGRLGPGSTAQTCGCLDRPMCIEIMSASYLDTQQQEIPFPTGQGFLTWNDPGNLTYCGATPDCFDTGGCLFDSTCVAPTPAHGASWGSIKGMYRAPAR